MTPQEFLARSQQQLAAMQRAKTAVVKVGLPAGESATSKAYTSDGQKQAPTVLEVGIWHEYGTQFVPMRSFLRGPFEEKQAEIARAIDVQFALVLDKGLDIEVALGRVGLTAVNISRGAFKTRGYGVWADIKQSTKAAKGSSQVLIDTGLLRNSITWVVE
jgi:hypothetical protein